MDGRRRGHGGSRRHAVCPPCPPGLWLVKAPSVSSRAGNRCCCSHLPLLPKQLHRVASLHHGAHLRLLRPDPRAPGLPLQRDAHKRHVRGGTPRLLAKPRTSSSSCSSSFPLCALSSESGCQHFTRTGERQNKGPGQELMVTPQCIPAPGAGRGAPGLDFSRSSRPRKCVGWRGLVAGQDF